MKKGFTLVELSIVLVIIGLLVGGILTGQELIRAAQINSLVADIKKYQTSLRAFELGYNGLAGDFKEASEYWPTECVDGGSTTCNGNGNGNFLNSSNNGYFEGYRAWQHLGLAEVINGNYNGLWSGVQKSFGTSYPESSFDAVGFQFAYIGVAGSCSGSTSASLYGVSNKNVMYIGSMDSTNSNCLANGSLSTLVSKNVDEKIDDGLASKGKLLATNSNVDSTGCAGEWSNSVTTADYDLTSDTNNCRLIYILDIR